MQCQLIVETVLGDFRKLADLLDEQGAAARIRPGPVDPLAMLQSRARAVLAGIETQHDQRIGAAVAGRVDGLGHQLLAGARLAFEQDGQIEIRRPLRQNLRPLHLRGDRHQIGKIRTSSHFSTHSCHLQFQGADPHQIAEGDFGPLPRERLHQDVGGAVLDRTLGGVLVLRRAYGDDRNLERRPHPADRGQLLASGEFQVDHDHFGRLAAGIVADIFAVLDCPGLHSQPRGRRRQAKILGGVAIQDQDRLCHTRILGWCDREGPLSRAFFNGIYRRLWHANVKTG